jgi:hypothetical protein
MLWSSDYQPFWVWGHLLNFKNFLGLCCAVRCTLIHNDNDKNLLMNLVTIVNEFTFNLSQQLLRITEKSSADWRSKTCYKVVWIHRDPSSNTSSPPIPQIGSHCSKGVWQYPVHYSTASFILRDWLSITILTQIFILFVLKFSVTNNDQSQNFMNIKFLCWFSMHHKLIYIKNQCDATWQYVC